ncbi:MAG: LysR family transcriptional regulator [Pseudomonadota bacterium]
MRITLHQLKVFHVVAELGSVTGAAHELHMTQPAVSNIIRQLEDYYHCPLTEVVGRKLSLTPFGTTVAESYQQLVSVLDTTKTRVELLKGGLSGALCLAVVSTARYFIPRLLGMFKNKYPDVHIKLTVCNRHDIIARLKGNVDDFVIMSHPPTTIAVDCADFYDDELVVTAPINHPLKQAKLPLPLAKLKHESWIFREEGSGTRYATENIFKKYQFSPIVEMEIGDNEAIKQAIMANMGISVLSKHSIKVELKHRLIDQLDVNAFPAKHTWYLVKNRGKSLPPIAESFFTFVNKHKPEFKNVY